MLPSKPRLYIPRKVFQKIDHIVQSCSGEVSGMGTCSYYEDDNYFLIHEVFLLDQEVGSAHTDIDAAALGKLEYECLRDKRQGSLNFWWHSHVNMSVFWSGQDTETINNMGKHGHCLATVFNKKGEMRTAVSFKTQFGQVFIDEMQTIIYDPQPTKELIAEWDAEIAQKVRTKTLYVAPTMYGGSMYGGEYHYAQGSLLTDWKPKEKKTKKWRVPAEREALLKIDHWSATVPEVFKDDTFIYCLVTGLHPHAFDQQCLMYSMDQWTTLDALVESFKQQYPHINERDIQNAINK